MWLSLPPDLFLEIFCRLEAAAALRCTRVCKPWQHTILGSAASYLRPRPYFFVPGLFSAPFFSFVPRAALLLPLRLLLCVPPEPEGQRQCSPAGRWDHAGDQGQAGAGRGLPEQRPHRVPPQLDRRQRRAAAERGGDRGHRHGLPHSRPRHVLHPSHLFDPPARQRS